MPIIISALGGVSQNKDKWLKVNEHRRTPVEGLSLRDSKDNQEVICT